MNNVRKIEISARILHDSSLDVDMKLKKFAEECLTEVICINFPNFVQALKGYDETQVKREILFKEFQLCKENLKKFDYNIYYGMLEWKDTYIKVLRHLIQGESYE